MNKTRSLVTCSLLATLLGLTIIRSGQDNLPAAGRLWVEPDTGRVVQTHLLMPNISVWTTFSRDERLQIDVPTRMTESYFDLSAKTTSRGAATYSNFRRFQVRTETSTVN